VISVGVRTLCRFQLKDLILHLILWCPPFFFAGSEVLIFLLFVSRRSSFFCWEPPVWGASPLIRPLLLFWFPVSLAEQGHRRLVPSIW
jgi:hypothetical protein